MTKTPAHMSVVVVLLTATLSACTLTSRDNHLGNAGLSQTQPTGVALAFQVDEDFGKHLASKDRVALSKAEFKALEYGKSGESVSWGSGGGAAGGTVVVSQPFRVGQSSCRRFTHRLTGDQADMASGTACRRGKGPWRLVR